MAVITTYDGLISRIANDYALNQPIWGETQSTLGLLGGTSNSMGLLGWTKSLPGSLPSGVTSYICTAATLMRSTATFTAVVAKCIDLGSLNIATPTFTDGSSFPTVTELGTSQQLSGPVWIEVTTVLNATPGSITITYVDQDGNTAETSTAQALPTASGNIRTSGFIVLNSGDIGVRDITTATRTGGTTPTGVVKFWGVIPIAVVCGTANANVPVMDNLLTGAFKPTRLGAGDAINVFFIGSASTIAASAVMGSLFFVGDS